jgi:hypothetical protein
VPLPLLLAGPIVRRVEPTLAAVWIALSKAATVRLLIWEGSATASADHTKVFVASSDAGEQTWRIGDQLHLGLLTARIPEASGKAFLADQLYSYDIEITAGGHTDTLQSLGMLDAVPTPDGVAHVPLGYVKDQLPSFAPPPAALADLRILYGSCRRPNFEGPDAMVWIDDMLADGDLYEQPSHRPHQLFLGGDQIYADDVTMLQMLRTTELGAQLIGLKDGNPIEHVTLDKIQAKIVASPAQDNPAPGYADENPAATAADPALPIDRAHFPEGRRLDLTRNAAQFTSEDGTSHLISLGEFAATYLCAWSNACWLDKITDTDDPKSVAMLTPDKDHPGTVKRLNWSDDVGPNATITLPPLEFPMRVPAELYTENYAERLKQLTKKEIAPKRIRRLHQVHREFFKGLPKVQRALANIPTYMSLDDHDVTDDYFLNPEWRDRVLTSALGDTIVTNAMIAYALFQDWGNDPLRYDSGFPAELLSRALELFPDGAETGPAKAPYARMQELFAHGTPNPITPDGQYDSVTPPILWHFTIDGPQHRVLALDNRTRRSYPSRIGPPGNVSTAAQLDQVPVPPKPPLPPGFKVLVVIAPLQVIGPPVLDEIVAPLSFRVFDLFNSLSSDSLTDPSSRSGLREMTATNPDAIEAWAFDAPVFENLLERLVTYQRIVLLSGDVHNSSGSLMSYWTKDATAPVRIAQFTSSGFKNVMPSYIAAIDRSAGFAQQMIRAKLGIERIGWDRPANDLVLLPGGRTEQDLVPVMRSRLNATPVMIPTWGWPDDNDNPDLYDPDLASRLNPAKPPDWRWRITPLLDVRADGDRPVPIQQLPLDAAAVETQLADAHTAVNGYQAIAARHQHALDRMRNARQILFQPNFGVCRFEQDAAAGALHAIHEVYTAAKAPDDPGDADPKAEAYLVQVAPLDAVEDPPHILRAKVIEAVKPAPATP